MKVGDQAPLLPLFLSLLVASNSFHGTAASFTNHLSESDNCSGVECDVIHSTLPSKAVMHIPSSYSAFTPATFQNINCRLIIFLMVYHARAKLLQYKLNSSNLLILCVLRRFHGIIISSFISPKILYKQAVSCGTHFKITYYTMLFCYTKFGAFIKK